MIDSWPYLDDIKTHVDDVFGAGAVVSGSGVALEGIAKVTAVQVVVPEVIMASPGGKERGRTRMRVPAHLLQITLK